MTDEMNSAGKKKCRHRYVPVSLFWDACSRCGKKRPAEKTAVSYEYLVSHYEDARFESS